MESAAMHEWRLKQAAELGKMRARVFILTDALRTVLDDDSEWARNWARRTLTSMKED